MLDQRQEELTLIAAFGFLFFGERSTFTHLPFFQRLYRYQNYTVANCLRMWVDDFAAFLMAWRALGKNDYAGGDMATNVPASPPRQDYGNSRGRSWPCSPNDAYCVVEEWSYY